MTVEVMVVVVVMAAAEVVVVVVVAVAVVSVVVVMVVVIGVAVVIGLVGFSQINSGSRRWWCRLVAPAWFSPPAALLPETLGSWLRGAHALG